ncbi:WD40 repeat-containing protein [Heterostelium album PN500]|uniref:WD40 repeat-containing protein n=1 Tax=Heterostelium pallidum (strain ATCC 26659 / Pp 5 / PN500) TaxID=670386 RepID=D3B291_HETP5|nr:WD40 repeat-containing protein [Heterostelium album PN500]EFA84466.1 WD40 repeat-containing protein [Heterostelium album PN500]|eukprot:XP_020436580.1 WD40 repeat-containing protein [Heterostelium album PN500]
MFEQAHCFERYVKTVADENSIVYGEYLSKLDPVESEQQLPYELQLEKKYFNDINVGNDEQRRRSYQDVMRSPNKDEIPLYVEPLMNLQSFVNGMIEWLNDNLSNMTMSINSSSGSKSSSSSSANSQVKSMCWHPQQRILAVCNQHDIISLYYFNSNQQQHQQQLDIDYTIYQPLTLWTEHQTNVTDIQWKPHTPYTLAVATENGIILWEIDINELKTPNSARQQSNNNSRTNATVLCHPYFKPTTLSWSSNGLYLASGSNQLYSIVLWDVASRVPTLLPRYGGNTLLSYSPISNEFLLSASRENFRIFDTSKWDYNNKQWNQSFNYVSCAWTPAGDYLAISYNDQINFIQCKNKALETSGDLVYVEKTTTYKAYQNNTEVYVGGHIKKIAISPDGNRLAVIFLRNRSSNDNDTLVALYRLKTTPNLSLTPRGFLKKRNQPIQSISFVPNYSKGSLLSVVSTLLLDNCNNKFV